MADLKDFDLGEKSGSLKKADSKKISGELSQSTSLKAEIFGDREYYDRGNDSSVKIKKKVPLAVDIIAGVLMVVITLSVIVGSYLLFRYYSNDYGGVDVSYTVVFDVPEELRSYHLMRNGDLFMDVSDNSVYFGKVSEVETIAHPINEGAGKVVLTVVANVRYREGEGYSIGDCRLAVGSTYTLRCVERTVSVTVVELIPSEEK